MVQLVLRMVDQPDEWGLVELQGKLETKEDVDLEGLDIGDLHFDEKGTPLLIVGHHLLTGKVVKLERPLAILDKVTTISSTSADNSSTDMQREEAMDTGESPEADGSASKTANDSSSSTEYVINAVIRRKVIFKIRPKPIVKRKLVKK